MVFKKKSGEKEGVISKGDVKKSMNFYKITTFVLVGVFVVLAVGFGLNFLATGIYSDGVRQGEINAVGYIVKGLNDEGYVNVFTGVNQSVTLVPSNSIAMGQEKLVLDIAKMVSEQGYVQLNVGENQTLTLVPYVPEQQGAQKVQE